MRQTHSTGDNLEGIDRTGGLVLEQFFDNPSTDGASPSNDEVRRHFYSG